MAAKGKILKRKPPTPVFLVSIHFKGLMGEGAVSVDSKGG
jgi:hypothetical protein